MTDFNEDIKNALEVLRAGGIILYPTDTVWGIGCDATNQEAVQRVFDIKQRKSGKSMLVLLENSNFIPSYVEEVPEVAWDIIDYAEKPTTIIYDKAKNLAPNLIASDGSIGIRITNEAFTQHLLQRFRKPIVSTSANLSNKPSPSCFDDIHESIKTKVDYIVKYRQSDVMDCAPSSIIRLGVSGLIKIIRK
ncbi:MAG: L-threonylcarbamoyladenylate synthase [Prolixibacteraceae bacterium]|jgi:L-threonylcarbamoyladenylate synthase|nr:L-threonylcarbamoyladenylate synthase [Prolixibacteraceae bacterium]